MNEDPQLEDTLSQLVALRLKKGKAKGTPSLWFGGIVLLEKISCLVMKWMPKTVGKV